MRDTFIILCVCLAFAPVFFAGENTIFPMSGKWSASSTATVTPTPTGPAIIGTVTYGDSVRPVPGVTIAGRWSGGGFVMTTTDSEGRYELRGFQPTGTYTITPLRNGGHDGSISSFDAARIAQHAAGIIPFTENQRLAADMSGDGKISSFDAGLASNWAVGSPPSHFASMWLFNPAVSVHSQITEIVTENYKATVLGDVTQNWTLPVPTPWPSVTPVAMPSVTPGTQPDWNRCDHYATTWGRADWPGTAEQPWDLLTGLNAWQFGYTYTCINAQPPARKQ